MSDLLKRLHTRAVWRCCQWAPTIGCAWVLVVILAGVWGGPYDCRSVVICDATAPRLSLLTDFGGKREPVVGKEAFSASDATGLGQGSHDSTSAALESEYESLMIDLNLGDLDVTGSMMSAIVPRMPVDIVELAGEERKKAFIGLMLPTVMIALDEVRQERQLLMAIVYELGGDEKGLYFAEDQPDWQCQVGSDKAKFILGLTRKYRTTSAQELVDKINVLPPSLILAQGAIESGWGASRIAQNSNNLFGMYSYMASEDTDGGAALKVMEYDSILDSVRAYILNLNRLSAYKELREIRLQTLDPMRIAEGLSKYSERKGLYIADVKLIIEFNRLQHYDALVLAAG